MPSGEHATAGSSVPRIEHINSADLCYQTFGATTDPAILLIGGASSSMDWWETEFCQILAAAGRFVVRYDLRDTGRSTTCPPGEADYTGADLADDARGLLDQLGIHSAHLAGISMGGGIAQRLALEHPERVASLTMFSTSPGGPGGPGSANPDLPPISERMLAAFAEPAPEPDWSDREAIIASTIEGLAPWAGSVTADPAHVRALVEIVVDRSLDLASGSNHYSIDGGEPLRPKLGQITAPVLVFHGTQDPLFPIGHGEALAREIPGARLIPLEGLGHEYPPRVLWPQVTSAILDHTAPADA